MLMAHVSLRALSAGSSVGIMGAVPNGHEPKAMETNLHYRNCPAMLTESSVNDSELPTVSRPLY